MRVKLECSPLGNKIKFRFQGKLVCKRLGELTKSLTLDRTDWVVKLIFGSQRNADSFLKKNRKMYIVVDHTQLLLDPCDRII
jgi:hypothetical protein